MHNYKHLSTYTPQNINKVISNELQDTLPNQKTVIENDVWIGSNAVILSGLTIGDGAVIGAGSVVTKDVAPYTIVVGNPAHEIKKRFSQKYIDRLLKICWWELSPEILSQNAYLLNMEINDEVLDKLEILKQNI